MLIMIIVIAIIAQVFRYKDYISTKMYKALLVCTTATILWLTQKALAPFSILWNSPDLYIGLNLYPTFLSGHAVV